METRHSEASDEVASTSPPACAERTLGVYPQRQTGLFMQRIKVLGGRIRWSQWRKVVGLAGRYSRRSIIQVTTRQDIELHDIAGAHLQLIQQELAGVGLVTRAACGDCVRNITVCPGCTDHPDSGDAFSAAALVCEHLADSPCDLPRKFKISFSGCPRACAKPWVSDLGFVAQGGGGFTAVGAGSLGPKPQTGVLLYKDLAPQDILPLCLATLELFRACGERQNRSRSRLRHLREKLGDSQFRSQLDSQFGGLRSSRDWPDVPKETRRRHLRLLWRLQLPNGSIGLDEAIRLAEAAEPSDAELRINLEHGLFLFGDRPCPLPSGLAALEHLPVVIACPGLSSCSKAMTNTWAVADAIRQRLAELPRSDIRICVSGCPNGCAHSAIADIGFTGVRRNRDGRSVECFRLFTGGGNGADDRQAVATEIIHAEDVPAAVARLVSSGKDKASYIRGIP